MRYFVLLCLLISSSALAQDLEFIDLSNDGTISYLDRSSVKISKNETSAWLLVDYSRVKKKKEHTAKILMSFRCNDQTYSVDYYISYATNVENISAETPTFPSYDPVVPGSRSATVLKMICQNQSN